MIPAPNETWRRRLSSDRLGLYLTLGYLVLTALGMLHRFIVFLIFRINIFDYAEPSDFLLSAFRDPLIILACVAPVPLLWLYTRGAMRLQAKARPGSLWYGSDKRRAWADRNRIRLYIASLAIWALAASMHYALLVANRLMDGNGRRVRLTYVMPPAAAASDTTTPLLLGTTQKFVFLFYPERRVTRIVPVDNVALIEVDRPRRKP